MQNKLPLLLGILLVGLLSLFFAPITRAEGSIDNTVSCKPAFLNTEDVVSERKSVCTGGKIFDEKGNVIPSSKRPEIVLHLIMEGMWAGEGEIPKGPVSLSPNAITDNGNSTDVYEFCSVNLSANGDGSYNTKDERFYPRVAGISFRAEGFQESVMYALRPDNPCVTVGGTGVGNSPYLQPLNQEGGQVGCYRGDDKVGSCEQISSSSKTPISTHADDAACAQACKNWYLDPVSGECSSEVNTDNPPRGWKGPFPSKADCNNLFIKGDPTILDPEPSPPPCRLAISNEGCTSVFSAFGIFNTDPQGFLTKLFSVLLSLSGGIALLFIIRSGYQLMTSQGDPEKVKEARERITSAIVGLLFIVFSLVILEVIGVDILGLPGLNR